MKKIRIAILTHYYRSINYGGTLQAYALARFLNDNGFAAKQVSYAKEPKTSIQKSSIGFVKKTMHYIKRLPRIPFSIFKRVRYKKTKIQMERFMARRMDVFNAFREENIPHTAVFCDENLQVLNHDFDIFITGSDQVFNFNFFRKGYFLGFVGQDKKKIAYAASMATTNVSEENASFFKKSLENFYAISVREPEAMEYINNLFGKKIALVCVDPTFLINPEQWGKFAGEKLYKEDYCFCYFLGSNKKERLLARKFSNTRGIKCIGIPMCRDNYHFIDDGLFDISFPDASPKDFVSLIKNAKYIFTDSFHACVFSILFNKKFVVFKRDQKDDMTSRIESLLSYFGANRVFLNRSETETLHFVEDIFDKNIEYNTEKIDRLIEDSISFLREKCGEG